MRYACLAVVTLLMSGCIYPVPSRISTGPDPQPQVIPGSVVVFDVPSEELKALVLPLRGVIVDRKDAIKTAYFFLAFADVVDRDKEVITSTAILREGFMRAEKLMLQETKLVGKYPGFGLKKDSIIAEAIGLDNVDLNAEKRAKAVAVLRAIAWVVGGADAK
jgi:hypothetical protein